VEKTFNRLLRVFATRCRSIALPLAVCALFMCCSGRIENGSKPTREETADRIMHNAEIEFTEEGKATGKLSAEKLLFFDKEHRTFGYDITVDFFNNKGDIAGQLTSDSGWVENTTRRTTVYGNVYLTMQDGTQLWTDSLAYYPKAGRIRTGTYVRIERGGEHIAGTGFDSDLDFTDIRIEQDVSGRLREN